MSIGSVRAAGMVAAPELVGFGTPREEEPNPPRTDGVAVDGAAGAEEDCAAILPTIIRVRQDAVSAARTNRLSFRKESLVSKSTKSTSCSESWSSGGSWGEERPKQLPNQFTRSVRAPFMFTGARAGVITKLTWTRAGAKCGEMIIQLAKVGILDRSTRI